MPVILGGNTGIYLASLTPSVDPDAQAFLTAAGITDANISSAINTLVVDLKGYNIWSKMKALYPFVGGTASTHKFNLKNPLDTNAAFRLQFNGGWTFSSTGALPNGTNAFADSFVNVGTHLALNSTHVSVYSRTNVDILSPSIGNVTGGVPDEVSMWIRFGNTSYLRVNNATASTTANTDSRGLFIGNRNSSTQINLSIRGIQTTFSNTSNSTSTTSIKLGGIAPNFFDTKELAFASIGDGLTAQNMTDLTTAVQAFQTTLGRSIGTQTVSDADAQAFVTAADIQDQVEANAINNLVIGMKADGLWTKMKACYPMVGGTNAQHSYNLKNPSQFQISWSGGVTSSSTGIISNEINGYGNTNLNPSTSLSLNSTHLSYYSRSNTIGFEDVEMGISISGTSRLLIAPKFQGSPSAYRAVNDPQVGPGTSPSDMRGLFIASRINSTQTKLYRNTTTLFTDNINSGTLGNGNIFLLVYNLGALPPVHYSSRECAFASIGDGLTDTDATNLNSRVTTFQTALNRNV